MHRFLPHLAPFKLLVIGTATAVIATLLYLVIDEIAVFYVVGAIATVATVLLGMPHGPSSPRVGTKSSTPVHPREGRGAGAGTRR